MSRLRAASSTVRRRWPALAAVLVAILVAACNNGGNGSSY